jgi:hypothetical protein
LFLEGKIGSGVGAGGGLGQAKAGLSAFARDDLPPAQSKQSVQAGQTTQIMWDKLRIRERERMWAMLFLSILAGVFGFSLLALGFPNAAQVVGVSLLGIFWLFAVRRLIRLWRNKHEPAPVGPLSLDEQRKARSKLLKGASRTLVPY